MKRFQVELFRGPAAQQEKPVPGVDLGDVGRHRLRSPAEGDDASHDTALSNVGPVVDQGVEGMREFGRAGGEGNVQALILQESPGYSYINRRVEKAVPGLHQSQGLPGLFGSHVASMLTVQIGFVLQRPADQ